MYYVLDNFYFNFYSNYWNWVLVNWVKDKQQISNSGFGFDTHNTSPFNLSM